MTQHSQQPPRVDTSLDGDSCQVKNLVRWQRILSLRLMLPSLEDLLGIAEVNKTSGDIGVFRRRGQSGSGWESRRLISVMSVSDLPLI